MIKFIYLTSFLAILYSCSSAQDEQTKIEKEYYENGKLKILTYHFKKDEIKVFKFLQNGNLDCIYNISNNNNDNLMIIFDGENNINMIEPMKNNKRTGTSIWFKESGVIDIEQKYQDGELIE